MKEYSKRNLIFAFVINIFILVLEIIGTVLSVRRRGVEAFLFYTEISNYFAMVVSGIFCIYVLMTWKRKITIPQWVQSLRFMATVCLVITLVVVVSVLIPMSPKMWKFLLFEDSNIFHHILCPLLSIVSFIKFEKYGELHKKSSLFSLIPTLVYGVVMITLNICKVIEGPYPFFLVYQFAWYVIILLLAGVFLLSYLIAFSTYKIFMKELKRKH